MINSQHHPLFFYGTLRSQEVRCAVLSKLECSLILVKGFILGYDLFRVKNTNYPLILKNKHSQKRISGFIVSFQPAGIPKLVYSSSIVSIDSALSCITTISMTVCKLMTR